jgi:phage-related protein (TIGR01555 family)
MKRADRRAQLQPKQPSNTKITDSYVNAAARLGYGTYNLASAGTYSPNLVSTNRQRLENLYTSSWLAGKAIDAYAEDCTKRGIEIHSSADPSDIEILMANWADLQVWDRIADAIRWGRLYGGAIAILLIDGQRLDSELRVSSISREQFKGLAVFDRWQLQPSLEDLITDFGPELGQPKYYTVVPGAVALSGAKVHHSRVIRITGNPLPFYRRQVEQGWGDSVLSRLLDRLLGYDAASAGTEQLVHKAHLRTLKVDNFRELVAAGGTAMEGFAKNIEFIRAAQSIEGLTVLDKDDDFEIATYSFTGLDNVLLQMGQQLAGGLGMPLTRLFGTSPAGLNATGESDLRTYYDSIAAEQNAKLRTPITTLIDISWRSKFGTAPPEGTTFTFRSLWDLSDTEKASIASTVTTAVTTALDHGVVDRPTAMRELRQSSKITGVFSNISDAAISEAESEPPPIPEADEPDQPGTEDPPPDATE